MSLDGYLVGPGDRVGHFMAGISTAVETPPAMEGFAFRTSPASAQVLRDALADIGALITGWRDFAHCRRN